MIRSFFFLFFLTLLAACDTASNIKRPDKNYFLKYFGGEGNQVAKDLIVNPDGTFFILGNSTQTTSSNTKVYMAKVDAFGNVIKQVTYGTFPMDAKDFELTSDGRLAVVANRKSATNDVLLSRFSLDLNLIDSAVLSVGPKSYSNSLTELKDGGFIIEGYQGDTIQAIEMHLRVDKSLQNFAGPGGWTSTSKAVASTVYAGVKTIQQNATTFYTFGYTNAFYTSINKKFWAYSFGYNGTPINNGDLSVFESAGGPADKIVTCAIKAAVGGYLLVGITNPLSNFSLKASITSQDTTFSFLASGVFQDKILLSNLGQGPNPYATAFSSTSYNFILANTYNGTASSNSDIILLKVGNDLKSFWKNPDGTTSFAQFGGSGEDTAAAVAELPDGHILVLGTMQLGNPAEQFKMVLMKLNANGQLQD